MKEVMPYCNRCKMFINYITYFASNWKFIPNTPVRKVRGKKTVANRDNTIYAIKWI